MADNGQTRSARRKQKKAKKKPVAKKILLTICIAIIAVGIGVGILLTYWIATAPEIDSSKLTDPFASVLLDKDAQEFAKLGSAESNRERVTFEELPDVLIDAVTATEDARFFDHAGIDLRRIGGAVIANITNGFGSQGASTITQQVVEKSFLSPEKKIKLKVQEAWLALQLERQYSKEEILEIYLNKIFYGANAYGVKQAASTFFGKSDLQDLTLPEAAILAGLPQRPTAYNPFENPELTKDRMDTVLTLMVRHEKITEEEANEAREVDITSLLRESPPKSRPYDAFIQQVEKEVTEKLDGADINTDGLTIYTTLDTNAQEYVESLLNDSEENPINYPNDQFQAAMVVSDTKTGAVQAIGGRRNQAAGEYNYAIRGGNQPGSAAKPILAFGPAIEYNKMSTYHQINDDKPYEAPGLETPIRNVTRTYAGWVTARHALAQSINVAAIKVFEDVGRENAKEFAKNLGMEFPDDKINLTDAIGGSTLNVNPLQMAGAYQAFGNEGVYIEPYTVTKVVFPDGREVDLTPEPEVVMSDYTAYMVTDMLKSAVTQGSGTRANVSGLPMAGKTGTSTLDSGEAADSWFAGYSTNYTIAVWTGELEDNTRLPISDTNISKDLFRYTMTNISEGIETQDFTKPSSVVEVQVEKGSNPPSLPSNHTPSSQIVTELFVKGTEPTSVSEKFDELDPVSSLQANYNEEENSIQLSWEYNTDEDVSFEVSSQLNDGEMHLLSTTDELSLDVSEVEPGEYQFQVIVVSNEDNENRSEPATTNATVAETEEEEDENEEEGGNIPPVEGLTANFIEETSIIDVTWNYNGPPASYEVTVNGQSQTVQSLGIEISGASPGQVYSIIVTPVGQNGANSGVRGESMNVEVEIPAEEEQPVSEDTEEEEEVPDENVEENEVEE
ncbi:PBP1A family penicillin-binding protein [Oceanobacillus bengalensis]|uniref:PBP1A family penicillin-binding protein n=1 Tax=Oceanobacillus bengalensis TaxID=1435466 RepID=A0A494YUS7_9BACI|nr:PBP1A family penicillin-binding protein [Oceanobacillus bengalensis]RKQ13926.1 PBP1A family penicillin-binding protein [Oceanobacillus bengalensis]